MTKPFRARAWCFTANEKCFSKWKDGWPDSATANQHWAGVLCSYLIAGREMGDAGNKHYQGYVEFHTPVSMKGGIKKLGVPGIHMETRKGTSEQAATYCMKEDKDYFETGNRSQQGERRDLDKICHELQTRKRTLLDIGMSDDAPQYCKYRNGIKDIACMSDCKASKKERIITEEVYSDLDLPTALRRAYTDYPDACLVRWTEKISWENYHGEDTIIVTNGNLKAQMFLRDGFQLQLEVKFGVKYAMWKNIVYVNGDPAAKSGAKFWWTHDKNIIEKGHRSCTEVGPLGNTIPMGEMT